MKKILLPGLGVGALVVGLAVVPIVAAVVKRGAMEVYILSPHAPDVVSVNRDLWNFDPPDPAKTPNYDRKLMEIYGIPNESKDKLVLVDKSKLVYPAGKNPDGSEKRPDLAFLPVDKQKGENPWQVKTVDFVLPFVMGGAVAVGLAFLGLAYVLKLRRRRAESAR